ncbi:hypothetical protein GZH53_14785 [Flavihumibacter sp. R14]|nr:hypothetical protein [Flavihumibacter soli]
MKQLILPFLLFSLMLTSCEKKPLELEKFSSTESFLPMEIGNYWRIGTQDYIEIQDTVRFGDHLYYKFFGLTGGDVHSTTYMRLDANNQLWEGYPRDPGKEYLKAKFDANVNDTFFTLNDQSVNDYKVKLIEKTADKRVFEMDMVYHPNFKGHPHTVTYIKGKGFEGPWKTMRISGVVY